MESRLTFKNIPIQGNLIEFTDILRNQGFETALNDNGLPLVDNSTGQEYLIGYFANNICEVYVNSTPISNMVYSVVVYMPKDSSWSSIESSYDKLKDIISLKYGNPTQIYESFPNGVNKDVEGFEYIKQGLASYASFWHLKNGIIWIQINEFNQISLHYEDKIGGKLHTKESDDIIYSDV